MDSTEERRGQKKELVNWKTEEETENKLTNKPMSRTLVTCMIMIKQLTFMSSESPTKKRKRWADKALKEIRVENIPILAKDINL